jgi:predicted phosphodiesterase
MGNTDEFLIGRNVDRVKGRWKQVEGWCREVLSDDDRAFIRNFSPTVAMDLGDGLDALCYHGSPRSNTEGIFPETADAKIAQMFRGYREKILVGGHTHSQMVRRFADRLILNPGSVGLPFEITGKGTKRNPPWAEFATVDQDNDRLTVTLRRVGYDVRELQDAITASEMPHRDWWSKDWKR